MQSLELCMNTLEAVLSGVDDTGSLQQMFGRRRYLEETTQEGDPPQLHNVATSHQAFKSSTNSRA